jgi:hypothetical protein
MWFGAEIDLGVNRDRYQRKPNSQPAVSQDIANRARGHFRRRCHRVLVGNFDLRAYSANQAGDRAVSPTRGAQRKARLGWTVTRPNAALERGGSAADFADQPLGMSVYGGIADVARKWPPRLLMTQAV